MGPSFGTIAPYPCGHELLIVFMGYCFVDAFHYGWTGKWRKIPKLPQIPKLPHSQHKTLWENLLLVSQYHHDFPKVPQRCKPNAFTSQANTMILVSRIEHLVHSIHFACSISVMIHCWPCSWVGWCCKTIHEHLGHRTWHDHGQCWCLLYGGQCILEIWKILISTL